MVEIAWWVLGAEAVLALVSLIAMVEAKAAAKQALAAARSAEELQGKLWAEVLEASEGGVVILQRGGETVYLKASKAPPA